LAFCRWMDGIGLVLANISYGVYGLLTPREYLGRSRLEMVPPNRIMWSPFNEKTETAMSSHGMWELKIRKAAARLKSREILSQVAKKYHSQIQSWDGTTLEESTEILVNSVEVDRHPFAAVIEVEVFHPDPHEAAVLANDITKTFTENLEREERRRTPLDYLTKQVEETHKEMLKALERYIETAQVLDIVDFGGIDAFVPLENFVSSAPFETAFNGSSIQTEAETADASTKTLEESATDSTRWVTKVTKVNARIEKVKLEGFDRINRAKRDFVARWNHLNAMREELWRKHIESNIPLQTTVVREVAESNEIPARPRVPLGLAISSLVGVVFPLLICCYFGFASLNSSGSASSKCARNPDPNQWKRR